jgi:hypothetical protein
LASHKEATLGKNILSNDYRKKMGNGRNYLDIVSFF